ncbi:class I SAM-dependent methyltransferase [Microbispora sp. CA-135349]|uniref:class I SAM-dependent methyltransferase n=1 Tax=Microbispora sp. CA-135349 TaxID=3239953 RepID=UPI003D938857
MFDPSAYGDGLASVYDRLYPHTPEADKAAQFIAGHAPGGRLLELGVGTGRLALPLAGLGMRVHGVDASAQILDKLKERDPEGKITATLGDFTADLPEGPFDIALIGLNTLFMVPDREQQIETLRLMRSRLGEGGVAIVETYDPWYYHRLTDPRVDVHHIGEKEIMIDTSYVSRSTQTVYIVHTTVAGGTPEKLVEISRYAWPSELDLMARIAGLRLRARYSDWDGGPVREDALRHISVFEVDNGGE